MIISISYIMLFSLILVGFCATSDARVSYNKRLFRKFVGGYVLAGAQVSYNKRLFHEFVGTVENYSNRKSHKRNDMYPFFWTTRERGIFMRYDLEFKLKCINDLRNGKKLITPEGVNAASFERTVREWSAIELKCGMLALKPKHVNKNWTADEKFRLISKVLAGNSIRQISAEAGIDHSMLRRWVNTYKMNGYQGLSNSQKGRPSKEPFMKKINYNNPRKIDETEYEELIRLRAENEYIKTEIEVIKKEIALREEKEAAQLKAKKQRLSRNSEKKDTN